jgi:hypothetical protein
MGGLDATTQKKYLAFLIRSHNEVQRLGMDMTAIGQFQTARSVVFSYFEKVERLDEDWSTMTEAQLTCPIKTEMIDAELRQTLMSVFGHIRFESLYIKMRIVLSDYDEWYFIGEYFRAIECGEISGCPQGKRFSRWLKGQVQQKSAKKSRKIKLTEPSKPPPLPTLPVTQFQSILYANQVDKAMRLKILSKLANGDMTHKEAWASVTKSRCILFAFEAIYLGCNLSSWTEVMFTYRSSSH